MHMPSATDHSLHAKCSQPSSPLSTSHCDSACGCRFVAQVPIQNAAWAVSSHATAEQAARAHDTAAIAIFGLDAVWVWPGDVLPCTVLCFGKLMGWVAAPP